MVNIYSNQKVYIFILIYLISKYQYRDIS